MSTASLVAGFDRGPQGSRSASPCWAAIAPDAELGPAALRANLRG